MEPRYYVSKVSGSEWARVMDSETGWQIRRYSVRKGASKNNGWDRAIRLRDQLNQRAMADMGAAGEPAKGEK